MTVTKEIGLQVSLAWWLKWWLYGLITVAYFTGMWPDPQKVARMTVRAIRIRYAS